MSILSEYAEGSDFEKPGQESVYLAEFIITECTEKLLNCEMYFNKYENSLFIDGKLPTNKLVFINLFVDGILDISVYDDEFDKWIINLPNANKQDLYTILH